MIVLNKNKHYRARWFMSKMAVLNFSKLPVNFIYFQKLGQRASNKLPFAQVRI